MDYVEILYRGLILFIALVGWTLWAVKIIRKEVESFFNLRNEKTSSVKSIGTKVLRKRPKKSKVSDLPTELGKV